MGSELGSKPRPLDSWPSASSPALRLPLKTKLGTKYNRLQAGFQSINLRKCRPWAANGSHRSPSTRARMSQGNSIHPGDPHLRAGMWGVTPPPRRAPVSNWSQD